MRNSLSLLASSIYHMQNIFQNSKWTDRTTSKWCRVGWCLPNLEHSVNCWNKSRCGVRLCWMEFLHNRGWAQWKGYPCLTPSQVVLEELNVQCSRVQQRTSLMYFYRAMHFSAKRSLAIACRLSVCPSVTLVDCDHIGWNSSMRSLLMCRTYIRKD